MWGLGSGRAVTARVRGAARNTRPFVSIFLTGGGPGWREAALGHLLSVVRSATPKHLFQFDSMTAEFFDDPPQVLVATYEGQAILSGSFSNERIPLRVLLRITGAFSSLTIKLSESSSASLGKRRLRPTTSDPTD